MPRDESQLPDDEDADANPIPMKVAGSLRTGDRVIVFHRLTGAERVFEIAGVRKHTGKVHLDFVDRNEPGIAWLDPMTPVRLAP